MVTFNTHPVTTAGSSITQHSTILSTLGRASAAFSETVKKTVFISQIYLMKAIAMTHTALAGTWSVTKILANNTAQLAQRVGTALFVFSSFAANQAVKIAQLGKKVTIVGGNYLFKAAMIAKSGLHTGWIAVKNIEGKTVEVVKTVASALFALMKQFGNQVVCLSQKVRQAAAFCFFNAAHFTAQVSSAAKTCLVQGFKTSKIFISTHQKETALIGCGIAVSVGALYVAHRLLAGSHKANTQTQTV